MSGVKDDDGIIAAQGQEGLRDLGIGRLKLLEQCAWDDWGRDTTRGPGARADGINAINMIMWWCHPP